MSHQIPDVKKDEDNEPKFLTLADKQPSVLLSGTASPRSISTRQLSDNLQATREGLINLMRKQGEGTERVRAARRSGSETDDDENGSFQNFGMAINRSGKGGNNQGSGSITGMTNKKKMSDKHGLTNSDEFDYAGLSNQDFRNGDSVSEDAQRGKYRSSDDDGTLEGGKFNQENDELFSSQNPKKDGPLYTRIFIDAFIPSLEGNRICPLFSYDCAEKRERSSKDFYERKRKLLQKQLPVVGTEDSWNVNVNQLPTEQREVPKTKEIQELSKVEKILKVEELREELEKVEQFQAEQKVVELHKSKEFQQVAEIQVLQKVEKLQEVEELQNVKEVQSLKKVDELQKIEEIQDLHNVQQMQEVVELQSVQKVEEKQEEIVSTAGVSRLEDTKASPQVSERTDVAENVVKSSKVESEQAKDSPVPATATKLDASASLSEVEQPSEEEKKLLLKVLRALLANDELIDIFCEKVISKIAARNDFCGPNCGSSCGGLNKPKTDKEK